MNKIYHKEDLLKVVSTKVVIDKEKLHKLLFGKEFELFAYDDDKSKTVNLGIYNNIQRFGDRSFSIDNWHYVPLFDEKLSRTLHTSVSLDDKYNYLVKVLNTDEEYELNQMVKDQEIFAFNGILDSGDKIHVQIVQNRRKVECNAKVEHVNDSWLFLTLDQNKYTRNYYRRISITDVTHPDCVFDFEIIKKGE